MMRPQNEKGATLLLVTWILLILTVIAGFLLYRAELEWAVALNQERTLRFREVANQVLAERLALVAADDKREYDSVEKAWFKEIFQQKRDDGYEVTLTVEDEGSKPNINGLTEKGLSTLLEEKKKNPDGTTKPALSPDPVLDWMDTDDEKRPDGAETPYYQGLTPAYAARNGMIAALAELQQLKDGAKYYQKIAPAVTVYAPLNLNTMNRDQFYALLLACGFDKQDAEEYSTNFINYQNDNGKHHFQSINDLVTGGTNGGKFGGIGIKDIQKVKPFLICKGQTNINLVNQASLEAILSEAGFSNVATLAKNIIDQRKRIETDAAFCQNDTMVRDYIEKAINQQLPSTFIAEDYFTATTGILRIKIWVQKDKSRFYLETVIKRFSYDDLAKKWKVRTLFWRELRNEAVPPLPEIQKGQDTQEETE